MKLSRKRSNFEKTKPAWTCRDSNNIFTPGYSIRSKWYSIRSKWYREFPNILSIQKYKGKTFFVTTAYFVDPNLICKDGGSQKGLGDRLLFQNGSSINDVLTAPLKQTDADSDVSFHFLITYINQLKIIKLLSTHLNTKKFCCVLVL